MEGLRIIFAREFEHLLARDLIAAEVGFAADLQILEIDHARLLCGSSIESAPAPVKSRLRQRWNAAEQQARAAR
jgi:hypothetical protein